MTQGTDANVEDDTTPMTDDISRLCGGINSSSYIRMAAHARDLERRLGAAQCELAERDNAAKTYLEQRNGQRERAEQAEAKLSAMYKNHPENACYDVPTWDKLRAENRRLVDALEFYAQSSVNTPTPETGNHNCDDGRYAREALSSAEPPVAWRFRCNDTNSEEGAGRWDVTLNPQEKYIYERNDHYEIEPLYRSPQPSGWQSIESAPKIGYIIGAWLDGKWCCRQLWWDSAVDEWTDASSDRYCKPTRWVPSPPSAGEGTK